MASDEAEGIGSLERANPIRRTEDVMSKGMPLEEDILKLVVDQLGRRIVITLDFIANDLYLLVDFMLRILTVEDDICQKPHSLGKMLFGYGGIEHGILLVSKGVQLTAHTFQVIDHLQGTALFRTLKGHVFTEMSQSFFPGLLITGADS